MTEHQVLFCPFCRDCFEGRATCPYHDLPLVGFDKLGPDPFDPENMPEVIDETELATLDPAFGRGYVAVGALLNALALELEFVRGKGTDGLTTRELATTVPSLWTLLLVTFTLAFILKRRRTPHEMRRVRVLVPALALVPLATVAWALHRLDHGATVWATGGRIIGTDVGTAVYAVALAACLIFYGGVRFGVLPRKLRRRALPAH
jgi:hypothetical protein